MAEIEEIYNDNLTANSQNKSSFFSNAEFLLVESSDHPDWSETGDFTEIDFDLLVTVKDGVKRRIDLGTYASTREVIAIPQEYTRSGFLMEVIMQASFSANIQLSIVKLEAQVELPEIDEKIEILNTLLRILMLFLELPSNLPELPDAPELPSLPSGDWFPSFSGGGGDSQGGSNGP